MKPHILILILILITPLMGCNEKISPSLQESNTGTDTDTDSGGDSDGDSDSDEDPLYYFKLTNTADASLGYKLHKTGSGNWNAECSIGSNTSLTNQNFTTGGTKDITCFLEAEELSIYISGLKFKIESAPNTCNFIQYVPYSYYNRMPGDSTTSYVKISCAEGVTNADVTTFANDNPSFGEMIEVSGGVFAGCNQYVNQDLSSAERNSFEEESPNFCRFNHSDKGKEQCDIGEVNVITYTISKEGLTISSDEGTTTTTTCGGKIMNCVKGPLKLQNPDAAAPYNRLIGLQKADASATQEYSYDGLINQAEYKSSGSYVYANYRRELANKDIEYGSLDDSYEDYASAFSDEDHVKSFDPLVLERYSKNRRIDGQGSNITTSTWESYFNEDNKYYRKPLASDAFLGILYRTNPFYTFECLDAAYEPKARIRMLVRDWDRVFNIEENSADENYLSFIENLTDIFNTDTDDGNDDFPSYARMDYITTLDNDEDIFSDFEYDGTNLGSSITSYFNDFDDWDDQLPLTKTSDRYTPNNGLFHPNNFPEDYKED